MSNQTILFLAIGIAVLIVCASIAVIASRKKVVYKKKGQLLLLNEQRFLTALLQALPPDTMVAVKVRLLDIISTYHAGTGRSLDEQLADYSVDFVLLTRPTSEVRLCIEMDGESQSASERLEKNTMISRALRKASVPHLRMPLVRYYDASRLRQIIASALDGTLPQS